MAKKHVLKNFIQQRLIPSADGDQVEWQWVWHTPTHHEYPLDAPEVDLMVTAGVPYCVRLNYWESFTVRPETKQRGGTYYVAYRRFGKRVVKHYLGKQPKWTPEYIQAVWDELEAKAAQG